MNNLKSNQARVKSMIQGRADSFEIRVTSFMVDPFENPLCRGSRCSLTRQKRRSIEEKSWSWENYLRSYYFTIIPPIQFHSIWIIRERGGNTEKEERKQREKEEKERKEREEKERKQKEKEEKEKKGKGDEKIEIVVTSTTSDAEENGGEVIDELAQTMSTEIMDEMLTPPASGTDWNNH